MKSRRAHPALRGLPFLLLAGAALAGCIGTGTGQLGRGEPATTGSVAISGPTFGDVTLAPTACRSGENEVFLGADFSSPESPLVLRLAIDPLEAPGVRIFDRNDRSAKTLVMRKADCASFHFTLGRNGWQINDVYVLETSVELDCSLPGGDRVRGKVATASCF